MWQTEKEYSIIAKWRGNDKEPSIPPTTTTNKTTEKLGKLGKLTEQANVLIQRSGYIQTLGSDLMLVLF